MNVMNCGVYSITSPSGNQYIGSSINIKKRWAEHLSTLKHQHHDNDILQKAWNKYNGELVFKLLLVCEPKDLLFYEQICIDGYTPEYNICKIAGNTLGFRHSEEYKEQRRLAGLGRKHTEESKIKISLALTGRERTPEHQAKITKAKTGVKYGPISDARRESIRQAAIGRKATEKTKEILKAAWVVRRQKKLNVNK